MNIQSHVLRALALLGLGATTAHAEVAITNRFTPSTIVVGGTVQYAFTVNSTEVTPLLNAGLTHAVSGVATLNAASATTTCGGSVTVSGTTLTWSGGTVPAAPPSGSSVCTVTVSGTANATPSTYTTTVAANTFTNTLGVSNRFASSASFNSTPLTLPTVEGKAVDPRVAYRYFGAAYSYGLPNATGGALITNPNAAPLTVASGTLNVSPNFSGTPALQGSGCSGTLGTPSTGAYTSVSVSNLTIPANGSCMVVFPVKTTTRIHYQAYQDSFISPSNMDGVRPNLLLTSVLEDTSMNGKTVDRNASTYGRVPIGFAKTINNVGNLTVSGGKDNRLTLSLIVKNNTTEVRRFSYLDPLIPAGDYTGSSVVSVAETRDQENTNDYTSGSPVARTAPVCSTAGITLDPTAKTVQYTDVAVPPASVCRFDVTFTLPKGSYSGTAYYDMRNNQVSTDFLPTNNDTGTATLAALNVQTAGNLTLTGSTGYYLNEVYIKATVTNPSATDMTGMDFDLPWGSFLPFTFNPARSYSTCGGTLSALPGGKGGSLRGGTVPSDGECKVVVAITPGSVTGEASTNVTIFAPDGFTTTSGHRVNSVSGSTLINLYGNTLFVTAAAPKVATGARTARTISITNYAAQPIVNRRVSLSIAPQEAFVPRDIDVSCLANPSDAPTRYSIPYAAATVSGRTLTVTLRDIPGFNLDQSRRADEQLGYLTYPTRCEVSVGVQGASAGTFSNSVTMEDLANYYGPTPPAVLTRSGTASYVESPTYTINKTFSPQTVYAGQTTNLQVTAPTPTSTAYSGTNTRFRVVDVLPTGMQVDTQGFTQYGWRQLPDGSWVYLYGYPYVTTTLDPTCDAARSCTGTGVIVSTDSKTLTYYTGEGVYVPDVPVLVTTFGDLINTIPTAQTSTVDGSSASIVADTSASVKVLPSIVARAFYGPNRIQSGQTTNLSMLVVNANPVRDTVRVRIPLPADVTPTGAAIAGCPGTLTQTFTASPRELVVTGVTLDPNEQCTLQIPVTARTGRSASTLTTTVPAGYVTAPASNTGNQVQTSALLSVDPAPLCVARGATQVTPQQLQLTSPGTGQITIQYLNNGGDNLGATDLTWAGSLPSGYTLSYTFDGATAQTTLQNAWATRVSQRGQLAVGETTTLTVRYTSASGKARGDTQSGTVSATVSSGACSVADTQTLTTIRAQGNIEKSQATCELNVDGSIRCGQSTTSTLDVTPCTIMKYTLIASNSGDAPLLQARLREPLPSNVTFLGVVGGADGNLNVMYSTDGVTWTATPPTGTVTTVFIAVDSNQDGAITTADNLPAFRTLDAIVYSRVKGTDCVPVQLPVREQPQNLNSMGQAAPQRS